MVIQTKKIKELYEDIQRKIYYLIPEKWDYLYLYSSVIDFPDKSRTGELFFYYIPKGLLRKNPVNVYEIPNKFNIDETSYLKLVQKLYEKIKELREEFRKAQLGETWSNITITIHSLKFRIEYNYENLIDNDFNSYERHVIWRYKYLNVGPEQVSKEDKEILKRYLTGPKVIIRSDKYDAGIYIQDIKNIVDYETVRYNDAEENVEDTIENKAENKSEDNSSQTKKTRINQILLSKEELDKMKFNG